MNKQTTTKTVAAPDNAAVIAGKIAILETWTQHRGALRGSKQYVEGLRARIAALVSTHYPALLPVVMREMEYDQPNRLDNYWVDDAGCAHREMEVA